VKVDRRFGNRGGATGTAGGLRPWRTAARAMAVVKSGVMRVVPWARKVAGVRDA